MSLEEKKIVSRIKVLFYEYLKLGRLELFSEFFSDNVKFNCPQSWLEIHGGDLKIESIDLAYKKAFEITQVKIKKILISGITATVLWQINAIHRDNFFGLTPSYKKIALDGQSIYSFDHQFIIKEIWQSWDMFGLVRQIDIDNQFLFVDDVKTYKLYKKLKLLTNRERQCIEYLLIGKTAKETAKILNLSYRTIEYYFENIKNKLGGCQKRDLMGMFRFLDKEGK